MAHALFQGLLCMYNVGSGKVNSLKCSLVFQDVLEQALGSEPGSGFP